MIKNLFEAMSGIEIFGIVSTILFFIVFTAIIIWSLKADKQYLDKMRKMPLDPSNINGDRNHD
jgi:hypothetical protein